MGRQLFRCNLHPLGQGFYSILISRIFTVIHYWIIFSLIDIVKPSPVSKQMLAVFLDKSPMFSSNHGNLCRNQEHRQNRLKKRANRKPCLSYNVLMPKPVQVDVGVPITSIVRSFNAFQVGQHLLEKVKHEVKKPIS